MKAHSYEQGLQANSYKTKFKLKVDFCLTNREYRERTPQTRDKMKPLHLALHGTCESQIDKSTDLPKIDLECRSILFQ